MEFDMRRRYPAPAPASGINFALAFTLFGVLLLLAFLFLLPPALQ